MSLQVCEGCSKEAPQVHVAVLAVGTDEVLESGFACLACAEVEAGALAFAAAAVLRQRQIEASPFYRHGARGPVAVCEACRPAVAAALLVCQRERATDRETAIPRVAVCLRCGETKPVCCDNGRVGSGYIASCAECCNHPPRRHGAAGFGTYE